MKIIKETSTELVMKIMPSSISIIAGIIASILITLPIGYIVNIGDTATVCYRLENNTVDCQFQKNLIFNFTPARVVKYRSVISIVRENTEGEDADGKKFVRSDAFFVTTYGKIPIYNFPVAGTRKQEKILSDVNKIDLFLKSQKQSIVIKDIFVFEASDIVLIIFLMLITAWCIPVICLAFRITVLSIDKNQNTISERYLSIFGFWKYSSDLEEIQKVEIVDYVGTYTFYGSVIYLKSGKMILFGYDYKRNKAYMKVSRVRRFLNLPIETR